MRRHKVIVADDSEEMRRGLADMLAGEYDVVALVENGEKLVEAAAELGADLLVIDVSMPVLGGLEALQQMKALGIQAKVVMVSTNGSPAYVRRALQLGASGYVLKGSGVEDLPAALRAVLNGGTFVSPAIRGGEK